MRLPRTSIAGLMGIVLVAALAFTALRSGSRAWAGMMFLVTCGGLALAVVGAVCRAGKARAWWLGFALFGGGYLALVYPGSGLESTWISPLDLWFGRFYPSFGGMGGMAGKGFSGLAGWMVEAQAQVAHCLVGLGIGVIGGLLALVLFGVPTTQAARPEAAARPEPVPARRIGRRAAILAVVGFVAALGIALAGLRWAAGTTAALASYATWGFLLLAIPAAAFGPRGRRPAWLGAALFGIGYMHLTSRMHDQPDWPQSVTNSLLRGVEERLTWYVPVAPPGSGDVVAANRRILRTLERPVPMHFPLETPLEDVLKHIQAETRVPGEPDLPIYVDPIALQEVEKTMTSLVTIDLEGPPLRTTLHLVLRQLGLYHAVGGGMLAIGSLYDDDPLPYRTGPASSHADPFLVVGHSLLAWLAAGLGAVLATVVCRAGGERATSESGTGRA